MKKQLPHIVDLSRWFSYDHDTGILRWQERPRSDFATLNAWSVWNSRCAGKATGCLNRHGRLVVTINGITYYVHRIIWKLVTGCEPTKYLDHRDCEPANNRWQNLREATPEQNARNRRRVRDKKSGLPKGVVENWDKGRVRYQVSVQRNNYIGIYDTVEEAQKIYAEKARELFGEFARTA